MSIPPDDGPPPSSPPGQPQPNIPKLFSGEFAKTKPPFWQWPAIFVILGAAAGYILYLGGVFDSPEPPPAEAPPPQVQKRPWENVLDSAGHASHVKGRKPVPCANCHTLKGDVFTKPDTSRCVECHRQYASTIHLSKPAQDQVGCIGCHSFLVRGTEDTKPSNCRKCHKEALGNRPAINEHGKAPCTTCHKPHTMPGLDPKNCKDCHQKQASGHAGHKDTGPTRCLDCHSPHEKAAKVFDRCKSCHAEPSGKKPVIPDTATFARGHDSCLTCHTRSHLAKNDTRECKSCHEGQHVFAEAKAAPHSKCRSCHSPHNARASAGKSCTNCHTRVKSMHPVPSGRGPCAGCHVPHPKKPTTTVAADCASCHKGKFVIGEERVPSHARCSNCHQAHNPRASARANCVRCHTKVSPAHPPDAQKGRCVGCHAPHRREAPRVDTASASSGTIRKATGAIALTCSSCHNKASSDTAFHAGHQKCKDCHAPHKFKLDGVRVCRDCHGAKVKQVAASNPGHQTCTRCHTAHSPKTPPPECKTCHRMKPDKMPAGHVDCKVCHDPHTGPKKAKATGCAVCHRSQDKSAPRPHRDCIYCHDPHKKVDRLKKACPDCHKSQAATPHGKKVSGGCQTCHRPHGPGGVAEPPACSSCHRKAGQHGLHTVAGHSRCNACHVGHREPRADRSACLKCHSNRKDHQPSATKCTGCHTFGGSQ